MPGNVQALSAVTDTYPFTTFSGFSVVLSAPTAIFEYPDGSSQRRNKAPGPIRKWTVGHRLSSSAAATMRTFYGNHIITPFRFKDVSNGLTYTAVFAGAYQEERVLGDRFVISLQLQEVA